MTPQTLTDTIEISVAHSPDSDDAFMFYALAKKKIDNGNILIIHEGQLTYENDGLRKVVDLGEWWHGETGLPLPLGGNAIKRSLPADLRIQVSRLLKESVKYALEHREQALDYALDFARDMPREMADQFVGMYV